MEWKKQHVSVDQLWLFVCRTIPNLDSGQDTTSRYFLSVKIQYL